MEISEHIKYWVSTSDEDFEVVLHLLNGKKFLHAMFLAHLSIEKLVKAHWVKDNENSIPPKTHNLISLIKQTKIKLPSEQLYFLTVLNDFQIQGRYPDYKQKVHSLLTAEYVEELIKKYHEVRKCLLEKLV